MSINLNGFEALEDRVLLAGNVTVAFNAAGDIVVTGDNAANEIQFEDNDGDGSYTIVGLNGTTVTSSAAVIAANIFDADDDNAMSMGAGLAAGDTLIVNLGKGNDYLGVIDRDSGGDLTVGINFTVNMGAGDDYVYIGRDVDDGINFGNVKIDLGAGNDGLEMHEFYADTLDVKAGDGDDNLDIGDFDAGSVSLSVGAGNDGIYLHEFGANSVVVSGGAGNDDMLIEDANMGAINIDLGAGNDFFEMYGFSANSVSLSGGNGSDEIEISDADMDALNVDGGAGSDIVGINNIEVDRTSIKMDGNNDLVGISGSSFYNSFNLQGGAKNDGVEIGSSIFSGVNTLNGGGGTNVLADLGGNTFSAATTIKFFNFV